MEIYRLSFEKLLILMEIFMEIFSHNLEKITKFYPMCLIAILINTFILHASVFFI